MTGLGSSSKSQHAELALNSLAVLRVESFDRVCEVVTRKKPVEKAGELIFGIVSASSECAI